MLKSSKEVLKQVKTRVTSTENYHVELMKSAISLVLYSLDHQKGYPNFEETVKNTFQHVASVLRKWVTNIINTPQHEAQFGGTGLCKAKEEIKVNCILEARQGKEHP